MGTGDPYRDFIAFVRELQALGATHVQCGDMSVTLASPVSAVDVSSLYERLSPKPEPRTEDEAFAREFEELVP